MTRKKQRNYADFSSILIVVSAFNESGSSENSNEMSFSPLVKVGSNFYMTIRAAYDAASPNETIKCRAVEFNEDLFFDNGMNINFEGGYNNDFSSNSGGTTTIKGSLRISKDTVSLRNTGRFVIIE